MEILGPNFRICIGLKALITGDLLKNKPKPDFFAKYVSN